MKQTINPNPPSGSFQPPTEVELQSLYSRWINTLFDLRSATGEWRNSLIEDLTDIYNDTLKFSSISGVKTNPYYRLITHRPIDQHLVLSKPKHNLL